MKLYISGPMRGYKDHNFPSFEFVRAWLRNRGHEVICPAETSTAILRDNPNAARAIFMRRDIEAVLSVEGLVLLDGWQKSEGACCEVVVGLELGLNFWEVDRIEDKLVPCTPYVKFEAGWARERIVKF